MLDGQGYDISCDLVMKVSLLVYGRREHASEHSLLPKLTYFPYLHNHEYFALDRVLLVSVGVCVFRARTRHLL